MKKLEVWNIPRSDPRDRCGECLLPFGKKKRTEKFKCKKYTGYRFPKVCRECKLLLEKLEVEKLYEQRAKENEESNQEKS